MIEILKEKYEVIRELGKGGMAKIFLAKDHLTSKTVAIKVLSTEKQDDFVARKRFQEEIKVSMRVHSDYVARIFDYEFNDKVQYIVMEYVDGVILREYISKRGRLNVDETVELSKQLSLGFQAIHDKGIIHRDIKPSNIMVTANNQIKIIDFGIALTAESNRYTKEGSIVASPHYVAPEIVMQLPVSTQSDIYSLGIVMFEMLTGEPPFKKSKDMYATVMSHKDLRVPSVNKYYDNIPQSLANIVLKATCKERKFRYKTMAEVYKDLSECLKEGKYMEKQFEPEVASGSKGKKNLIDLVNSKITTYVILGVIGIMFLIVIIVLMVVFV